MVAESLAVDWMAVMWLHVVIEQLDQALLVSAHLRQGHGDCGGGHGDCRDRRQTLTEPSPSLSQSLYLGSPATLSQYMLTPIISYVFSTYYYTIFFSGIFLKIF